MSKITNPTGNTPPPTENYRQFIQWFRDSSPYIHAHRGRLFVLYVPGEAVVLPICANLIHDIALLNSLGAKLVLVHGARPQIDSRLQLRQVETHYHQNLRVTSHEALDSVKEAVGHIRVEIEALLSQGLINTPMAGARLRVSSGNFITAQPMGVVDGVDYQYTGKLRRIDTQAIRCSLESGDIVLISPIGYSPSGEVFNLSSETLACEIAVALRADKLLLLVNESVGSHTGQRLAQLTPTQAEQLLQSNTPLTADTKTHLACAIHACRQGVARVHLINHAQDGGLLIELFSRDGCGTLINADPYETLRPAVVDDVAGVIELIVPHEQSGALVRRSRERLETEIGQFSVIDRDGMIIACAALYPYVESATGELACLSLHPHYHKQGLGLRLLQHVETKARELNLKSLFALTTLSEHWFKEQGFVSVRVEDLPVERQKCYNYSRSSKVFLKQL